MHLFLSIECSWRILNIFKGNCSLWQDLLLIRSIHFISSFILKSIYCIAIMVWNRIVSCILCIRWKKEGNTSKGNWVNHLSSSDLIFIEGLWQRLIFLPCRKKNTQRFQPKPLWSLCKEKQSHRSWVSQLEAFPESPSELRWLLPRRLHTGTPRVSARWHLERSAAWKPPVQLAATRFKTRSSCT